MTGHPPQLPNTPLKKPLVLSPRSHCWVTGDPIRQFSLLPLADLNDMEGPMKLLVQDLQVLSSLLFGMWGQVASGGDSHLEVGAAGVLSHQAACIRKSLLLSQTWDLCSVQGQMAWVRSSRMGLRFHDLTPII